MTEEAGTPGSRSRVADAEERSFDARSLVGSFFHGTAERRWQGCVVAEPSPGVYLVELFSWASGQPTEQRLVRLADMAEWSFYDSAEWMNNATSTASPRSGIGNGRRLREPRRSP